MNLSFQEAEKRFWRLKGKLAAELIDDPTFEAGVEVLTVTDGEGKEWRLDAERASWQVRRDDRWVDATTPPDQAAGENANPVPPETATRPQGKPTRASKKRREATGRKRARTRTRTRKAKPPKPLLRRRTKDTGQAPLPPQLQTRADGVKLRSISASIAPLEEAPRPPDSVRLAGRNQQKETAPPQAAAAPAPAKPGSVEETPAGDEAAHAVVEAREEETRAAKAESTSAPAPSAARVACPGCGAEAEAGVKFCTECGASLQPPEAEPESETVGQPKFCTECGAALEAGAKFCTECGTRGEDMI